MMQAERQEGLRIVIDGVECLAARGATLLQAAAQAGVDIPSVCADPRIEPLGTCRLCCVEVEGLPGSFRSPLTGSTGPVVAALELVSG